MENKEETSQKEEEEGKRKTTLRHLMSLVYSLIEGKERRQKEGEKKEEAREKGRKRQKNGINVCLSEASVREKEKSHVMAGSVSLSKRKELSVCLSLQQQQQHASMKYK